MSMSRFQIRGRWWWLAAIAAGLFASLAALLLRPKLEHAVRTRIESAAVRHGMVARIGLVHVGVWPLLRLEGFDLDVRPGVRLHADKIAVTWPGRLRLAVRGAAFAGPAGVSVSSPATAWDVAGIRGEDLRLTLVAPQAGLSMRKHTGPVGSAWNVEARGLDVGHLLDVRRDGHRCSMVILRTAAWMFRPAPTRSVSTWILARAARAWECWRITLPTNRSSAIRRT